MIETPILNVLDVVTDFLATEPTDEELLAYQFTDEMQERIHYLLERNGEGELTCEERHELDDFIRANRMMARLKVNVRLRLADMER